MAAASRRRCPSAPVLPCRSLPARSTRWSLPTRTVLPLPLLLTPLLAPLLPLLLLLLVPWLSLPAPPPPLALSTEELSTTTVKMEWEREEPGFISVAPTARALRPPSMQQATAW